ncbi:MAG: glycogen debranching enzyme N-terminal domain-containing protein [Chloroflexi bacterium]|nr:glycogen debranching enzyme N-terminal domain-containing protein [Chloroflexota bacterium]MCY3938052.1 glycogen debranching enzyme N-terminal domain-containing protein [Chloroflexota bacterium]
MISTPVAELCLEGADLTRLLELEWLVTNGIGGYASSTVAGVNTRRYHSLLVAATRPPAGRRVLLASMVEELRVGDEVIGLSTAEYEDGSLDPQGWNYISGVKLVGTRPVVSFTVGDYVVDKTVWMERGLNQTWVQYTLASGPASVELQLLPLVTNRDFHAETRSHEAGVSDSAISEDSIILTLADLPDLIVDLDGHAEIDRFDDWFWNVAHRRERERGFEFVEDLLAPCVVRARLDPGSSFALTAYLGRRQDRNASESLSAFDVRAQELLEGAAEAVDTPTQRLVLAADQFLVGRGSREIGTVIAGYHWFGDWGRDTMIALPGLTLATGRAESMRGILVEYASYVSQGMLPNRFPDDTGQPEYNTVDATLWWFEAVAAYLRATGDDSILRELLTPMVRVVDWHLRGSRYGIRVDSEDGLLYAGEPGSQLTWMDAKAGDWVVTPRIGKPVEVNALWYSALRSLERWLGLAGFDSSKTRDLADRVSVSFRSRFWNEELGFLYDVVDGPDGDDSSLRPNQLFALSVSHPLLHGKLARSVVARVRDELLTPFGLRTLSPSDPKYGGKYGGGPLERDGAYHQGTVWPWLIGTYVDAHLHAFGSVRELDALLDELLAHLDAAGLGSIAEIFGGDVPHPPDGCVAQAWSVAEVLRSRVKLTDAAAT